MSIAIFFGFRLSKDRRQIGLEGGVSLQILAGILVFLLRRTALHWAVYSARWGSLVSR